MTGDEMRIIDESKCHCHICYMAKVCDNISKHCNKQENAVLDEMWGRMEYAETELEMQKLEKQERKDSAIVEVKS